MTPRVALATCRDFPLLIEDDRPLLAGLGTTGVSAEPVLWDADVDWTAYAAVVLRSVWDYWLRAAEFVAWLERLEHERVPCWNPAPLVRWNLDKRYLRDLAARGIPTVETLWIDPGDHPTPADAVARILDTGWSDVVLKPTVSAGAWRTLRVSRDDLAARTDHVALILSGGALMAQPFVPEVLSEGEHSFLFFGGAFSHAVLKRPRAGDFRVQWIHGGAHGPSTPPLVLVDQARAVLAAAPSPGLYARVDGVLRDGRLLLMELEQIEPYLFFAESPGSHARFLRALRARLDGPG